MPHIQKSFATLLPPLFIDDHKYSDKYPHLGCYYHHSILAVVSFGLVKVSFVKYRIFNQTLYSVKSVRLFSFLCSCLEDILYQLILSSVPFIHSPVC